MGHTHGEALETYQNSLLVAFLENWKPGVKSVAFCAQIWCLVEPIHYCKLIRLYSPYEFSDFRPGEKARFTLSNVVWEISMKRTRFYTRIASEVKIFHFGEMAFNNAAAESKENKTILLEALLQIWKENLQMHYCRMQ